MLSVVTRFVNLITGNVSLYGDFGILTTSPFILILKKKPPQYNRNTVALSTTTLTSEEANGLENYIIVQIQEKCQFKLLNFSG